MKSANLSTIIKESRMVTNTSKNSIAGRRPSLNKKESNPEFFQRFITVTKDLDKVRNQDFLKLNPEFKPYF